MKESLVIGGFKMNMKIQDHKDFIRLLISLILISIFFLLIITSSSQASVLSMNQIAIESYSYNPLQNMLAMDIDNPVTLDYFLANQDLFLENVSKGFYFSEVMNSIWLSNNITSMAA